MNWFRRLFRRRIPRACVVAELLEQGELVELRGTAEALNLLHDPLDGSEAVLLKYSAVIRELADSQLGLNDPASLSTHSQGANFLLRDASGVALIEVDAGEDLERLHNNLLSSYGAGIEVHVEAITPGEVVRVRGRVRSVVKDGSPHRGAAWSAVISEAEIERS